MRAAQLARTVTRASFAGFAGILTLGLMSPLASAAPVDREACLNSSEQGQKLRQQGKFQEALKQFQICAQRECPGMVQRDCTQWLTEVSSSLPTVTLSVQDEKGRDLIDVVVSVDGKNILSKLEGKAIPVDPGVHTFLFEAEGKTPLEERVVVSEGDKAKKITVTLKAPGASSAGTGTGTGTGIVGPPTTNEATGGHTIFPWLVVGGGVLVSVVGAVLYFGGKGDFPSECTLGVTDSCKTPGYTEEKRNEVLASAKSADDRITIGLPVMIGGGVLIAAGLTWFFLEPPKKRKATPHAFIRPDLGFGYAGLSGSF